MNAAKEMSHPGPRGHLRHDEPMARHTSWRVGGPARHFFEPADLDDLAAFLADLPPEEPVFWLGLGSNLLVRDGGIPGTVVQTSGLLREITRLDDDRLRIEAGVACAKVARFASRLGLRGAEFLAGIPGTMGGALAMNAGAFGAETWTLVEAVETIDRCGLRRERAPGAYRVGYREVRGPVGEWFVAAHLKLATGRSPESSARIKDLLRRRAETQPLGLPSCGSVFRNPQGDFAARLIDASGLKGLRVGGACVSDKHANFIVNTGGATAADIEALMGEVMRTVEQASGVRLQPEVKIVGRASAAPGEDRRKNAP